MELQVEPCAIHPPMLTSKEGRSGNHFVVGDKCACGQVTNKERYTAGGSGGEGNRAFLCEIANGRLRDA